MLSCINVSVALLFHVVILDPSERLDQLLNWASIVTDVGMLPVDVNNGGRVNRLCCES